MKNVIILLVLCFANHSFAGDLLYFKYTGGAAKEVSEDKVQSTCNMNFIFRDELKEKAPAYLEQAIIKAAFTGNLLPSIEAAVSSAKSSNKCLWVTSAEKSKL